MAALRAAARVPTPPRDGSRFSRSTSCGEDECAGGRDFLRAVELLHDRPTLAVGVHLGSDSYRYPDSSGINLRVQKAFEVGPGKIAVIVECFNCNNNANMTITNTTWGDGPTPLKGFDVANQPTSYVRTFQLALRYDF